MVENIKDIELNLDAHPYTITIKKYNGTVFKVLEFMTKDEAMKALDKMSQEMYVSAKEKHEA